MAKNTRPSMVSACSVSSRDAEAMHMGLHITSARSRIWRWVMSYARKLRWRMKRKSISP
jgi:hypothetical protein